MSVFHIKRGTASLSLSLLLWSTFALASECHPVRVESPDHSKALEFIVEQARRNHSKISLKGAGYSQGNQTCANDVIQISMNEMIQLMTLDIEKNLVTVQAGMSWKRLQEQLEPFGLAVSAMQSYNDFSIGGALGVNAHGQDIHWNPVSESVESVKVLLTDGQYLTASRTENPELFSAVLGSYGMVGIITEVTLKVVPNHMLIKLKQLVPTKSYDQYFKETLKPDSSLSLHSARLSINPLYRFHNMVVVNYFDTGELAPTEELLDKPKHPDASLLNYLKYSWFARVFRTTYEYYFLEKESRMSRNQAMGESVTTLANTVSGTKDILQEYFVPPEQLQTFINSLRKWTGRHNDTFKLLNATVRWVNADKTTILPFAPDDRFAVVLFMNLSDTEEADKAMAIATRELINETLKLGGRYYLPYALYATRQQLYQAYPEFQKLIEMKNKYDPEGLLTNELFETYAESLPKQNKIAGQRPYTTGAGVD
ncbi:FAD-binding oxidoreductase [Sansalvadorimonas sp. 2012CJ34-2]|uniref:FAD-binding oxidoreductase n=1 Tax=Parendozoicomonas callyspongiae TaxID=2942213 RepID=A0ABT0PCL1_9GAMM|nr:FAD-binding oxidoreductase [Sansalvadorimonas sp. 2012CJ34-2]MCL6268492.1 FAD-binding oxidoreductase [Sansalvadorimonas sp. 2012CJ34-2]